MNADGDADLFKLTPVYPAYLNWKRNPPQHESEIWYLCCQAATHAAFCPACFYGFGPCDKGTLESQRMIGY